MKRSWRVIMEYIIGLVGLVLWVWAIIKILGSSASGMSKLLWILLVIVLPFIGFIIWFFAGPK